jgi:hypothetical protein
MTAFESSHKSLLMGVSQQVPEERLPGQLTAQLNMLSDPVTNLRRRPGLSVANHIDWSTAEDGKVIGWFTDVAGVRCHVLVNIVTGGIILQDESYNILKQFNGPIPYLQAAAMNDIRATTVGNEFFLANVKKAPTLVYPGGVSTNPLKGFAYITSGAFGKLYSITLSGYNSAGAQTWTITGSYTTPSGSGAGDAAASTPEEIATRLMGFIESAASAAGIITSLSRSRQNAYMFFQWTGASTTTSITVNVNSGASYMIGSKGGLVNSTGDLPAQLPPAANGYVVRVGAGTSPQYYQYQSNSSEWLESGSPGSPTGISNVPISIYYDGTDFQLATENFAGRKAGDNTSNPLHEFMQFGITGIGTYQGRLVLMSGPLVSLSASNEPRNFFRTTVTSVLASDPIETGSSLNSSASYEYALSFQKDLVLFSKAYQAVLPSGNAAITPSTATVVPTSAHEVDTLCSPVNLGRTLMYAAPRSQDFFGTMEMVPSPYTDSQYVSQESTPHLPKYMPGRCKFAVSSSVSNLALFGPTGDRQSLIVHEYVWDGDQKIQQAWHTWTFPYNITTAYFASEKVVVVMVSNGVVIQAEVDTKAGTITSNATRRPYLDIYVPVTITDRQGTIPTWLTTFDPDIGDKLKLAVIEGDLAGEFAGMTVTGNDIETVISHPDGEYAIGIPFRSSFSPTPPVIRDYNEVAIQTTKATVLRYAVGTRNSSFYRVRVSDLYSTEVVDLEYSPLEYSSPELSPGRAIVGERSINIVPARTDMATTLLEIYTEGSGELNLTSLEYVAKYNQKIRRR